MDKTGQTIDFLLTAQRDEKAAKRFLTKAIRRHGVPAKITIDGSEANAAAIRSYNKEHGTTIVIRQVKYLNNIIRFADEARALNVARMNELPVPKRLTLAVALIRVHTAQALDDLAEMCIRRLQKLHHQGQEALEDYRDQHQEQTDALITLLGNIVSSWQGSSTPEMQLQTVDALIGTDADTILAQCETHLGYAGNNYLSFLCPLYRPARKACLDVLALLRPTSTSTDTAVEQAIAFVLRHRQTKAPRLSVCGDGDAPEEQLALSWIPRRWRKAVTGRPRRDRPVMTVDRKYLELCVLSCVMVELKSGDLCIAGSEQFSDYRDQLVSWDEYAQQVGTYCQQVGIPADPTQCV